MRKPVLHLAVLLASFTGIATCVHAQAPGFGPNPTLDAPHIKPIPTVHTATATGWPEGGKPVAAKGLAVSAFADKLDHPRWIYVLPNGDVLVAETNAPPKPEDGKGIKGFVMKQTMKKAGAGVESPNRLILLRDTDGDGVADLRNVFAENLNSPFGMTLYDGYLYVANSDAIVKIPYKDGDLKASAPAEKLADQPAGPINHHWTKDVIVSPDGKYLYATVGSNSNVGENGIAAEEGRAAVWQFDRLTGKGRVFATGLRNPNGLAWDPQDQRLWVVVNERDELGDDLVPDYMTSVKDGGFYGWPYSYYGQHVDTRMKPQNPALVSKAIVPDYALGAHTASLGLTFYTADLLGAQYKNGAFIGQHGSWNRSEFAGYKVIFLPFANGKPVGEPQDILTGFVSADDKALGRPVGVATDSKGALLVADDVGNVIWRVTPANVK